MPAISSDLDFLLLVKKSGLLSEEAIQQFERSASAILGDPNAMAAAMIRQGLITPFHSKILLTGKHPSFILGPYKILEPIGKGGMGRIYLAEHTTLLRRVAIKVLPADKAQNQEVLQRFHREARAAAALDHPNIVKIFDVGQGAGTHYLVMEYVSGKTLQQIVSAKGPLPYQQAIQFIIQTATGLKHAHEKGFIHRDIKPDNIIRANDGTIKILDMGLARSLHSEQDNVTKLMNPDAIYGSVDYISPEQSLGGTVDARSDIYSLGATLFALLSGVAPYSGTAAQVLMSHQLDEAPKLTDYQPTLPTPLNDIIAKMMAKQPGMRYRSASEVIEALRPWASIKQQPKTTTVVSQVRQTVLMEPQKEPALAPVQQEPRPRRNRKKKAKPGFTVTPKVALTVVGTGLGIAIISLFLMIRGSNSAGAVALSDIKEVPVAAGSTPDLQPIKTRLVPPLKGIVENQCLFLDIKSVANVISSKNLFNTDDRSGYTDSITLPSWGRCNYHGVPFDLIDPQGKMLPNVLVFQGGENAFTRGRPARAVIPCHSSARVIHILGGISGWAFPHNNQRTVALVARLRYQDGSVEEHKLINGTHFADWRMPQADVPTAPIVAQFDNERHLRYISITPNRLDEIAEIEFIKGDNKSAAPIFFAITVEKP